MIHTKEQLLNIFFNVYHIPGWLRILEMSEDFDQEDIISLEQIDERAIAYEKIAKRTYREVEIPKNKILLNEFKESNKDFTIRKRLEYLNTHIKFLDQRIKDVWNDYQKAIEEDQPYWFRKTILELRRTEGLEKKLKSFSIEKYLLEHPEDLVKVDRVTPEEIARAMDFPFNELVEFNNRGFAKCMFHDERTPSFHWYKDSNRVYCHGCNWSGNTIKFLMARDKLSFKVAVRKLIR